MQDQRGCQQHAAEGGEEAGEEPGDRGRALGVDAHERGRPAVVRRCPHRETKIGEAEDGDEATGHEHGHEEQADAGDRQHAGIRLRIRDRALESWLCAHDRLGPGPPRPIGV